MVKADVVLWQPAVGLLNTILGPDGLEERISVPVAASAGVVESAMPAASAVIASSRTVVLNAGRPFVADLSRISYVAAISRPLVEIMVAVLAVVVLTCH
ncbi:hypothetical protein [Nonomuraea sp. NEAU-A123]|uniref:hypothetical protein n=1 Tax=Nonomuraea sp. NEAU-A123 TaxID=2839649 RepID=UPI0020324E77|nr:hypothetical protein [Nonomuraea sp. NEAU-A123]